jgi:4-carboxymuconolactone decarboxylase
LGINTINFPAPRRRQAVALASRGVRTVGNAPTTEDRLRAVARGDFESVGLLVHVEGGALGGSGLDAEARQLVQIAALVAIDAPHVSWLRQLEAADEQEIELEKILGTLLAVAPVVGSAKIVAAGAKIVRAEALGEEFGVLTDA